LISRRKPVILVTPRENTTGKNSRYLNNFLIFIEFWKFLKEFVNFFEQPDAVL
jgi:hypothetical protein